MREEKRESEAGVEWGWGGAKGRGVPVKSTHCREFVVEDTSNITASELTTTLSDRERRELFQLLLTLG